MRKDAKLVFKFLEKHGDELIERLYSMAKNNQKIDVTFETNDKLLSNLNQSKTDKSPLKKLLNLGL